MRTTFLISLVLATAAVAYAAQAKTYQTGTLTRMESVECGYDENGGKGWSGVLLGTDSNHKKMRETLCQEYVLDSDRVTYRIRPTDEKHPELLPVGRNAEFRLHKDKLILLINEKERSYHVISMTPKNETQTASSSK